MAPPKQEFQFLKLWEMEHPLLIHIILSDLPLLFSHCFLNLSVCWLENINSLGGPICREKNDGLLLIGFTIQRNTWLLFHVINEASCLQTMNPAGLRVSPTLLPHLPRRPGHLVSWLPLMLSLCFPIICASPAIMYLSFLGKSCQGSKWSESPLTMSLLGARLCANTFTHTYCLILTQSPDSVNPVLQIREGGSGD